MSNWGTLNHHHLPFYSIETFIRAAKNANKTLVICFLILKGQKITELSIK